MSEETRAHLSGELLQAYAGRELAPERARAAKAHLSACARCSSELEAWTLLFEELEELPDLGPSPDFAERVMAGVKVRSPFRVRLVEKLRGLVPVGRPAAGARHLSPTGIQEYLDGLLGRRVGRRVADHLGACARCRDELEAWAPVFRALEALPELAPSAGFQDRVMAEVEVRALAPVPAAAAPRPTLADRLSGRLAGVGRRLVPSTRRGWALAGGLVSAPAVGLLAVVAAVFSHPLLSFGDLATYVQWRAFDWVGSLGRSALALVTETPAVYGAWEFLAALLQTPGFAVAGLVALWCATLMAGWVLYRNVIAPSLLAGRNA